MKGTQHVLPNSTQTLPPISLFIHVKITRRKPTLLVFQGQRVALLCSARCLEEAAVLPAGGVVLLVVNEVIQTVFVAHEGSLSTLDVSTQKEGRNNVGGTRNAQIFGHTARRPDKGRRERERVRVNRNS